MRAARHPSARGSDAGSERAAARGCVLDHLSARARDRACRRCARRWRRSPRPASRRRAGSVARDRRARRVLASGDVNDGRACWRAARRARRDGLHARRAATRADAARRTDADDDGDASDIFADPPPSPARAARIRVARRARRVPRLAPQASSATVRRRASGGAAEILPTFAEGMEGVPLLSAGATRGGARARARHARGVPRAIRRRGARRPAQPPAPARFQGPLADAALFRRSPSAPSSDAPPPPRRASTPGRVAASGSARGLEAPRGRPPPLAARAGAGRWSRDRIAAANRANRDVTARRHARASHQTRTLAAVVRRWRRARRNTPRSRRRWSEGSLASPRSWPPRRTPWRRSATSRRSSSKPSRAP